MAHTCGRCRPRTDIARRLGLTELDRDILSHVLVGETDESVAAKLNTSTRTVRRRMARLASALDVQGRVALAAAVVHLGLIHIKLVDCLDGLDGFL